MHTVGHILYVVGWVYLVILFVRAIVSWFPESSPGSPLVTVRRISYTLTEPVLAPFRRVIPPVGALDLSFTIVMLLVFIITTQVFGRIATG